jgi:predicted transposase/invertase (TIGR01784 family)
MASITPRVDIAFKKIFGVEENKDLLISLINSIVSSEDQVADVQLLNPYNAQSFRQDKLSILDIKAKGVNGKRYNIEMQISDEADYDKRALYYWAKLYTEQLKVGQDYTSLSKAIGIHILNFTSIVGSNNYHNVFHIKEKNSNLSYFKDLELHTIELKKFYNLQEENLSHLVAKIQNGLDLWVTFLSRHDLIRSGNVADKLFNDELDIVNIDVQKAIQVLDEMNFSQEERNLYEDHLKWLHIEASTLLKSRQEGFDQGQITGRMEGRMEGRMAEKLDIANKLLQAGMSNEEVAKITTLTMQQIIAGLNNR